MWIAGCGLFDAGLEAPFEGGPASMYPHSRLAAERSLARVPALRNPDADGAHPKAALKPVRPCAVEGSRAANWPRPSTVGS